MSCDQNRPSQYSTHRVLEVNSGLNRIINFRISKICFVGIGLLVFCCYFVQSGGAVTNELCSITESKINFSNTNKETSAQTLTSGKSHTNSGSSSSVIIDLGKKKPICFIDIGWNIGGKRTIQFQISAATGPDSNFTEIFSSKSKASISELQRCDFQDIFARYLKITVLGTSRNSDIVSEINVYAYKGTSTASRLPQLPNLPLYDNFENISTTGKLWDVLYTGRGFAGTGTDKDGYHSYNMYPVASKAINETHAVLVRSTDKFSNFKMVADVKTNEQLRLNSTPKKWEVAWILFRYSDTFHYYWFSLKPNGIELGKKDCQDCVDPVEGQIILYTAALPTLRIGQWSQWTIEAVNNHITISIDGNKVIDMVDTGASEALSSGNIAMYTEDASVSYDNFYVSRH